MNKFDKFKMAAAAAAVSLLALGAGQASAVPTVGTIPGGAQNDFITTFFAPGTQIQGWYGADLYLIGAASTITVEYFGAEAGFVNSFTLLGSPNCTFTHNTGDSTFADVGNNGLNAGDAKSTCSNSQNPGLLPFNFLVNGGALTVSNGSNGDNTDASPNFFVSFANGYTLDTNTADWTASSGQSVFLFLDDGGADNDDNHDDMVIRISITGPGSFTVPEPGSLAIAGLALLVLGLSRRRAARV